jgi:hypothetical protein
METILTVCVGLRRCRCCQFEEDGVDQVCLRAIRARIKRGVESKSRDTKGWLQNCWKLNLGKRVLITNIFDVFDL